MDVTVSASGGAAVHRGSWPHHPSLRDDVKGGDHLQRHNRDAGVGATVAESERQ